MKRLMCVMISLTLLFAAGCANNSDLKEPSDEASELLQEYLKNIDEFEMPSREVGEPNSYIAMDESFAVGIFYPKTEIKELNDAIEDWIDETVDYCKDEIVEDAEDSTSELTVSYESFKVNDNLMSVKMKGNFLSSKMAHPVDVIKTFIIDISKEKVISVEEVIKEDQVEVLINKVASIANVKEMDIDDEILENAVVTKEGIEVILERGKYLPMSDGTVEVSFSYDEIRDLLIDNFKHDSKLDAENEKTPSNKLEVIPKSNIDPEKPMVALTFDDGPSMHTERLLDVFEEYGGSGTFFVLGYLIDGKEEILTRAVQDGHELGNHSFDHSQLTNLSDEQLTDQIMKTRALIYSATGYDTKIMRPPYGAYNEDVLRVGATLDTSFVNWSLDTLDWKTRNADAVYNSIMNTVKDGDIILCHDLHGTTVDAMERVIPALIDEGYQLVTVSQLMEYSDNELEAGKMYMRQ